MLNLEQSNKIIYWLVRVFLDGRYQRGLIISILGNYTYLYFSTSNYKLNILPGIFVFILVLRAHKWGITTLFLRKKCRPNIGDIVNYLYVSNYGDQSGAYLKEKGAKMSLYRLRPIWPGERYLIKAKVTSIKNNLYELEIIPQSKEFVYKRSTKFPYLLESTILGEFIIGTGNNLINAVREKDLLVTNF